MAALGVPYRSQHPVWATGAILDFALLDQKVAIEVDGPNHKQPKKKKADQERTAKLEKLGWRVVRIWNEDATAAPHESLRAALERAGLAVPTARGPRGLDQDGTA